MGKTDFPFQTRDLQSDLPKQPVSKHKGSRGTGPFGDGTLRYHRGPIQLPVPGEESTEMETSPCIKHNVPVVSQAFPGSSSFCIQPVIILIIKNIKRGIGRWKPRLEVFRWFLEAQICLISKVTQSRRKG